MNAEKRVRGAVTVIVVRDGMVLVLKRKGAVGDGTWAFPGGKLEFGESFDECGKREIKEETGVDIKNISFALVQNDYSPEDGTHFVNVCLKADYAGGEAVAGEPDKCEEVRWVDWESIPDPHFPSTENILKTGYRPF